MASTATMSRRIEVHVDTRLLALTAVISRFAWIVKHCPPEWLGRDGGVRP
jgi:hypothetical protein